MIKPRVTRSTGAADFIERFEAMAPDGEEAAENPATTSVSALGAMKASDATHIISVLRGRYCKAAGGEKDFEAPSDITTFRSRRLERMKKKEFFSTIFPPKRPIEGLNGYAW